MGPKALAEVFEQVAAPVADMLTRGAWLRRWRGVAIDGFEVDVPATTGNAAEFGHAGSGDNRLAFPKARVVALAKCGTHAFLAAEVGAWADGEKTLANRLYPRLRGDELLTADRNFYSFTAWDLASRTGAGLLWRAPTGLGLPVVRVLPDGTYLSVLINPKIRGAHHREAIMTTAREVAARHNGEPDPAEAHLVRVVEYDVPDRAGNGTGELIVVLSNVLDPAHARADELATAYHQRWEEETSNDQLKTHLRGPGRILRSRLPELVHQEIWAWLLVHYALSTLAARAAQAAALDPDRISFTRVLRITAASHPKQPDQLRLRGIASGPGPVAALPSHAPTGPGRAENRQRPAWRETLLGRRCRSAQLSGRPAEVRDVTGRTGRTARTITWTAGVITAARC